MNRFALRLLAAGVLVAGLLGAAGLLPAGAALLENLRDSIQEFTLENGLRVLVIERHDAPVFSYATCVDAGGVCETTGKTGIAHMFEHMAFKGTEAIGTEDYDAERKLLAKVDEAWDAVLAEQRKGFDADSTRLAELQAAYKQAREEAKEVVIGNEFAKILEQNGARGINAFTGTDMTCYFYSLPSNRLELCMRMEAGRLAYPVLREFYLERDVVRNERRIGTESSAVGRMFENFLTTAFMAHPYKNGVIGHTSDIEAFHRRDAREFYETYYVAPNMTAVFVGDVTVDQVKKLAKKYLAHISEGSDPPPVTTIEPVHTAERRIIAHEDANPMVIIGWQCPAVTAPDFAPMELLMEILAGGRSSRLYERLVKEEKVAANIGGGTGLPGNKYPNQAVVFVTVAADEDPYRAEQLVYEEIERLITEGPTAEELEKVKTSYLASEIRQIREPSRLALQLAIADQILGHWNRGFTLLDRIEQVTLEDIQRLAEERLTQARRTVGIIEKKSNEAQAAAVKEG
ncbi:MAG: insulinase family protein [Candidatus Eisenbacteria sp.]|nr:insulinase family protein [Candidatus Eisenbacteria bacterium]